MEINYFSEFVVLAETCSFLEAANILYISQSTLSKHIKRMEKELGVQLFDRTTRNVQISEFGELLLPYARQVAKLKELYTDQLQSRLQAKQKTLNLGAIPDLAQYRITDVLYYFRKNNPHSVVNVVQASSKNLKEMLRKKKIMLAFIRITDKVDEDLVEIPYTLDKMAVILQSSHSLANHDIIPLSELAGEEFLLMDEGSRLHSLSIEICEQCGFTPKIAYTDQKLGNLVDMVSKGMGITLMMKQLALHLKSQNTAVVEISPCISTKISLCYLKGTVLTETEKAFVEFVEQFENLPISAGI